MPTIQKLLEPITVGPMELRNRIVMPAMGTALATHEGFVTNRLIDYYSKRARGGVGLIFVENAFVDRKASKGAPCSVGICQDEQIPGLGDLAECIQRFGAKAAIQILHYGRQVNPVICPQPVAPSEIPYGQVRPRALTLEEIEEIEEAFAQAARRAMAAEFDGVEVHGAHGYLIGEFLSPHTNKRTDGYSGFSFEGRARFPLEVLERVREEVHSDLSIIYRISADEYVKGGLTLSDTGRFAQLLNKSGLVDAIHVSAAIAESGHNATQPIYLPHGYLVHLAEGIKKVVDVPVIAVGSINTAELAEEILQGGKADLIAMGRAIIADPELPKKIIENRIEDIRPCIRCNWCNRGALTSIRCTVNVEAGRESFFHIEPAKTKKKILIAGGGVAGMEAALVAASRGYEVILCEKGDRLGGLLIPGSSPPFKDDLKRLLKWYETQMIKGNLKIRLGKEVTPALIFEIKPDVLIIAVGSGPITPKVPGIEKHIVTYAPDVLNQGAQVGERMVVLGGGSTGCETSLYLAEEGKEVTLVEVLDNIANDIEPKTRIPLIERLHKEGVRIMTETSLVEVCDDGASVTSGSGKLQFIQADGIVLAVGMTPHRQAVESLERLVAETYKIGDCVKPQKLVNAIHDGAQIAAMI